MSTLVVSDNLLERDLSKYTNVFIDESQRFRTETTHSYEALAQICRGKRVILVSATPLNNTPRDILSQVKLFQNGKASTIPNLRNLEAFFPVEAGFSPIGRIDYNLRDNNRITFSITQRDNPSFNDNGACLWALPCLSRV